jgi:hypothetical protein
MVEKLRRKERRRVMTRYFAIFIADFNGEHFGYVCTYEPAERADVIEEYAGDIIGDFSTFAKAEACVMDHLKQRSNNVIRLPFDKRQK